MTLRRVKCLLVATFSLLFASFFNLSFAQENADTTAKKEKKAFDANEVIFGHISDGHEFHFFSYESGGKEHEVTIPLPVILYSPQRGLSFFMSSKFDHGKEASHNYFLLTNHSIQEWKLDPQKFHDGQVVAVDENGQPDFKVKVYDLSLTRNVVQMFIALGLLVWVMLLIAKRYQKGEGVKNAPKGIQNLIEPIITFIRDDVAKPNLGHKYEKYLPYIQTVFFFILINNVVALIPGTANVSGNIAFTMLLALISFLSLIHI